MTTGRLGLLEHGHRRSIRRGRRTFQGLRAGRSSGRRRRIRWGRSTFRGLRAGKSYTAKSCRTNNCYCATAPLDLQTYNAGYIHMEIEAPPLVPAAGVMNRPLGCWGSDEVC